MASTAQMTIPEHSLADRASLTLFLSDLADSVGAEFYMLLTTVSRDRRMTGRVIASNWVFDAIELVGVDALGEMTRSNIAIFPGARIQTLNTAIAPEAGAPLNAETTALLNRLGHAELYCLRLNVGRAQSCLLLSGPAGNIDAETLGEAQMRCNYMLSGMPEELRASTLKNGLTGRERECLAWAAEGKTSEEIAVILGLHSGIANATIATAMEKLHARNRVEAIATAIRSGIL